MNLRLVAAMVVAGAVAAAASAAGMGVRASYGARLTGDEPHYLLTAISLAEDRDLDVSDEVAAERYRDFHEVDLDPQGKPRADDRLVEPHDPLLPALLATPAALGGWPAAKGTLIAMSAALAALLVWVSARRLGVAPWTAAVVVAGFAASAPLAVYGQQLYPELPAALAVTVALAALGARPGLAPAVGIGAAIVALPWLSVKFVPVAAVLAMLALVRLARAGRRDLAIAFAVMMAAAGAGFVAGHLAWYGGVTPYASGEHFVSGEFSVVGVDPDLSERSPRLIGLLVDRTFGLAAWQPAWLLAIPALGALIRSRPRRWPAPVLVLAAGWLTASFVAVTMHGWWWPGRQVVVVLPALVLAVVWWVGDSRTRVTVVAATAAVGIVTYVWVVADGLAGRITWVVDFFETGSPFYRAWRVLLPDYTAADDRTWILHGVWLAIAAALVAVGWIRAPARRRLPATMLDEETWKGLRASETPATR